MPQLEAGYYVEVQTWISYLCPPLCRVRRRGASPLDPSFMLLLYIWTLSYIRLPYLDIILFTITTIRINNIIILIEREREGERGGYSEWC